MSLVPHEHHEPYYEAYPRFQQSRDHLSLEIPKYPNLQKSDAYRSPPESPVDEPLKLSTDQTEAANYPQVVEVDVGGRMVRRKGCPRRHPPTAVPMMAVLELVQPTLSATHPGWIALKNDLIHVGNLLTFDGNHLQVPVGKVGYDAAASWGIDCLWIPTDEARSNNSNSNNNNSLILPRIAELMHECEENNRL
ncbi:hypothetical protein LIER_35352 [Lithospermum erythrorhizon]|uniref:Uncharacterized protein n=1 Tax=Lithospermum erythrorhizon TaxID=34254 RepID=A0AAV3NPF7_LITER